MEPNKNSEKQSRRSFIQKTTLLSAALPLASLNSFAKSQSSYVANINADIGLKASGYSIIANKNGFKIIAGHISRNINTNSNSIKTADIQVNGTNILSAVSDDFQVTFCQANPNRRPMGIKPGDHENLVWPVDDKMLKDKVQEINSNQDVKWENPLTVNGDSMSAVFRILHSAITSPGTGATRLNIRATSITDNALQGIAIDVFYEVYAGYPVIRKWVEFNNNSQNWFKIDSLVIDNIKLSPGFLSTTLLTPEERGAGCSIKAFGNANHTKGVIAVSEIPSAMRMIGANGEMGYNNETFEWVLGPSENFISEPVFMFAYDGVVEQTISGKSTPLDRAVEGPFKSFLEKCIGIRAVPNSLAVPLWCSWTNFVGNVNNENMREQADIAARAGFVGFQIDAGWGSGSKPYKQKFPDFDAACKYITAKGLRLGLWISDYRDSNSDDFKAIPAGRTLPGIKRGGGLGMSFASNWRDYYANNLVGLHDRYGMTYVKQDLSVIKFGDLAEGHESRTLKESLLRGVRGLLNANDTIARKAPGLATEITHEIYWGTPGVPCDVAALKHACTYHIPPNEYYGCGKTSERPNPAWTFDPLKLRNDLLTGCAHARERFFAHRGLPLYCLEFYSATTVNFKGSLTAAVQDRQICSWLMGAPSVYSGDLATLNADNIEHYRKRFEIVKQLQKKYDIYRYYQYSGVPEPTDTDWHWWGKLNSMGYGAVVVLRGSAGNDARRINIPWVVSGRKYRVISLLSGKKLGVYTGAQLKKGELKLSLPVFGQDILELATIS